MIKTLLHCTIALLLITGCTGNDGKDPDQKDTGFRKLSHVSKEASKGRKNDSLALMAIKQSASFSRWADENKWNSAKPLERWGGVYLESNRVSVLELRGVYMKELPPQIGKLTALTEIDLSHNNLALLPPEIGNCTSLEILRVSGNHHLTHLPPETGKLKNLLILNASSCGLTSLPSTIGNCVSLKDLNLYANSLPLLPPEIGQLENLTSLELWGNNLTSLPEEIRTLSQLAYLNCGNNNFSEIPQEVGDLENLRTLDFSHNENLTFLPRSLFNLTGLASLKLSNCSLESIDPAIGALRRLSLLDLSGNSLQTLPEEIVNLKEISSFDISFNSIDRADLPSEVVPWLGRLVPDWQESRPQNVESVSELKGLGGAEDSAASRITIVPERKEPYYYTAREYARRGPPGGNYFALLCSDSSCRLDTVRVDTEGTDSVDTYHSGRIEVRSVRIPTRRGLRMLVRGIPGLARGHVKTWYVNPLWDYDQTDLQYRDPPADKERYRGTLSLDSIGTFRMMSRYSFLEQKYDAVQWRVRFGNGPWWDLPVVPGQTTTQPKFASAELLVLWIGDLDRDGAPDMFMRPILDHSGFIQLFLSGQRRPGRVWESAATFFYHPIRME